MTINIHSITSASTALETCHHAVSDMLPDAMGRAITAYKAFVEQPYIQADAEKDPKVHQAHQAACKASLQHIELLMKLAAVSSSQKQTPDNPDIADLMAKADQEVNAFQTASTEKKEER